MLSHQVLVIAKANESLCDFLIHALTKSFSCKEGGIMHTDLVLLNILLL